MSPRSQRLESALRARGRGTHSHATFRPFLDMNKNCWTDGKQGEITQMVPIPKLITEMIPILK
jgi:hypothetical protein